MNWKIIIAEIQEYGGLTQTEIGEKCGTTQSTISSLINREGGEPSFSLGVRLEDLHKKIARKNKKPAPAQSDRAA